MHNLPFTIWKLPIIAWFKILSFSQELVSSESNFFVRIFFLVTWCSPTNDYFLYAYLWYKCFYITSQRKLLIKSKKCISGDNESAF